ncbi:hypothetical protein AB5N19_10202 [Seiridium cardinale]
MAAGESPVDPFSESVWESHRATITDLYQTRNLPLNQVVQYMRSQHGFKPTLKMYKYRLKKWNLRKYLRHSDVVEFIHSNERPEIRGAKASRERIDGYLRQRGQRKKTVKNHGRAAQQVDTLSDDQKSVSAQAIAPSIVARKVRLPGPCLSSPHSPDSFRLLEGSIHAMRSYTSGNLEANAWMLDSRGDLNARDLGLAWHGSWYTVRHLMDAGRAKQAFRIVQKCNQIFEEVLVSGSPRFFSSAFLVFLGLSSSWPDLAASVVRYMHSLSRIKFSDSNHPMVQFLFNLHKLGPKELSQYGDTLAHASVTVLQDFFPFGSRTHVEPVVNVAQDLFHLGITSGDSAVSQISTVIRQLEASGEQKTKKVFSAKRELIHVYLQMKDYTKALQLVSDMLSPTNREFVEGTYNEIVYYRQLFEIHKALGDHQRTISACRKAANLCMKLYGPAHEFTVNNLALYENYLRECGNDDGADQVKGILTGALDELCSGIEELTLVT